MVGSLDPEIGIEYYVELLKAIKSQKKEVKIQGFSAPEIAFLAEKAGKSYEEILVLLKEAGLSALGGGGAEIFSQRIRKALCPQKIPKEIWLEIHKKAHSLNIPSNATMLFGHIETKEEIISHLNTLRELQNETSGFMSFIPFAFLSENTELAHLPKVSATQILKIHAISRLFLDNFPHITAFWMITKLPLLELLLSFGVDDINGTVYRERIVHLAGSKEPEGLSPKQLQRIIQKARKKPIKRDSLYKEI
jgi:aminodeoxyfutalosine synthase